MSQPRLIAYIELNQKYGHGYQGHIVMEGRVDSVIDNEPYGLDDAYIGCVLVIEEINKNCGYSYDPYSIIQIRGDAIEANKRTDFTTARVAKDIEKGHGELTVPLPDTPDMQRQEIDGKQEVVFSARGVVITFYLTMMDDPKNPKAKAAMMRYCQYLANRRYGQPASAIFDELAKKDIESGINWIKATFGKYVSNQNDLINFVMR